MLSMIRIGRKPLKLFLVPMFACMLSAAGCLQQQTGDRADVPPEGQTPARITRYEGQMGKEVRSVYTTNRELSLTFNGMADAFTMKRLLDQLDECGIKATFFLSGMRVAEEPELAAAIIARGHEIENNTLNRRDLTKLPYEDIYKEIRLANEIIERETGIKPQYVRTKSGDYNDEVRLAAAHAGLEAVVYYSVNPRDWDMKSAWEIADYVAHYITRGGIITLSTDINPAVIEAIPLISQEAERVGYKLVTLKELIRGGSERKPLELIEGYDAARINPDYANAEYHMFERMDTGKREVALTFDDWGKDYRITQILDILSEHDVKASFFLRMDGVKSNPNLARAIAEEGHDVANHTYNHPNVTEITAEELQEQVVESHKVLTEAIQRQPAMLFRPPYGAIDETAAKAIAATGYKHIAQYDVTTFDWDTAVSAGQIVASVMEQTGNGSIILLHLQDELHTADALPDIITRLKDNGYAFVRLSDWVSRHNNR